MKKTTLVESLENLPEEFSLEDIIERLIILDKLEDGRKQYEEGKIFTHDQVKQKLEKWLK
jgi:predicted transcriptional regulator